MAVENIEVRQRPSLLVFMGVGLLLFLLLISGLWWAKNRSESASHGGTVVQNTPQSENKPAEEAKPQETPQTQGANNNAPQQSTPSPSTPAPNVPSTGPSDIPATGPSARDIVLSSILMGMAGYFALRLVQIMRSMQP